MAHTVSAYGGSGQDGSASSAFGDLLVAPLTPALHLYADTAGDTRWWTQYTSLGGTITTGDGRALVQNTTTLYSYASLQSNTFARYWPGIGNVVRFAARFSAGVSGCLTGAGVYTAEDGLWMGYQDADFGSFHRVGRKLEIQTLTLSAGAGGAENVTITLGGTAHIVAVTAGSAAQVAQQIASAGPYADAVATYEAKAVSNTVSFQRTYHGAPPSSTFTLTSTGTTAGTFAQTQAGAAGSQYFAPIGEDGGSIIALSDLGRSGLTLNPALWNVYQISFGWLGAAGAVYSVRHPYTGRWVPFAAIPWPNSASSLFLRDPRLNIGAYAASLGSTTAVSVELGSVFVGHVGTPGQGVPGTVSSGVVTASSTETPIVSVRNAAILRGAVNRRRGQLRSISVANTGAKEATIRVLQGATLTGQLWTQPDSNSIVQVDTSATAVSSGTPREALVLKGGDSRVHTFDPPLDFDRNDRFTVTAQTPASTTTVIVSINGVEDP